MDCLGTNLELTREEKEMSLGHELEAAYIGGDCKRVLSLMAANDKHKGSMAALLNDWGKNVEYNPEYEKKHLEIDGYPVRMQGAFSLAVVEYLDGTRRAIYRGRPEVFREAVDLLKQEGEAL